MEIICAGVSALTISGLVMKGTVSPDGFIWIYVLPGNIRKWRKDAPLFCEETISSIEAQQDKSGSEMEWGPCHIFPQK